MLDYNSEFLAAMQAVAIYGIDFAPRDQCHIKPIKYSHKFRALINVEKLVNQWVTFSYLKVIIMESKVISVFAPKWLQLCPFYKIIKSPIPWIIYKL